MADSSEKSVQNNSASDNSARTLAEWTTLIISVLIVGGLTVFLVLDARQPRPDLVGVQTRLVWSQVGRRGSQWILPVEVKNPQRRHLREVHLEVTWRENGEEKTRDIALEYLGAGGTQRAYVWFGRDPRQLRPQVEATYYVLP